MFNWQLTTGSMVSLLRYAATADDHGLQTPTVVEQIPRSSWKSRKIKGPRTIYTNHHSKAPQNSAHSLVQYSPSNTLLVSKIRPPVSTQVVARKAVAAPEQRNYIKRKDSATSHFEVDDQSCIDQTSAISTGIGRVSGHIQKRAQPAQHTRSVISEGNLFRRLSLKRSVRDAVRVKSLNVAAGTATTSLAQSMDGTLDSE